MRRSSFFALLGFMLTLTGVIMVDSEDRLSNLSVSAWILMGVGVIAAVYSMAKWNQEQIRKVKTTQICPTCKGTGEAKKEESDIRGA